MHTALSARARAQLVASDVFVARGPTPVLQGVDLAASATSRIAIVGENGRGKSTLLHVLAGTLAPDAGAVTRVGTIGLAEQEMSTADERTVGDAVGEAVADSMSALKDLDDAALALSQGDETADERYAAALERAEALEAWDAERRVCVALEALAAETDWSRPLVALSVGQRYRVRLACLLGATDDFLLLDEPTNHLDREGLVFLTEHIQSRPGGVILITHDRALLTDVAQSFVDLDPTPDDRPRIYGGGYAGYRDGRRAERERWEQDYERQEAQRQRLQEDLSAAQNRLVTGWRPDKGTGKHQRATRAAGLVSNVHRRRAALEAHSVTMPVPPRALRFPDLPTRAGVPLLTAEDVVVESRVFMPVSVRLEGRSRLVVTGPNGAGKSTVLGVLAGELEPTRGRVHRAYGSRVGLLHQESSLPPERRASDLYTAHIDRLASGGLIEEGERVGLSTLGLLGAREASKRVGELSMGQQRRLSLAMVLAARPHILLLDEPTNHLSMTLVDELMQALDTTKAAVVLSSHDRQLLRDVDDWPQLALATTRASEVLV